jgi:hypothetical protein
MEKTGVSENELKCFDKTLFELMIGMDPDTFTRLYQAGVITIKQNINSLNNFVKDFGINKTIEMFKAYNTKK